MGRGKLLLFVGVVIIGFVSTTGCTQFLYKPGNPSVTVNSNRIDFAGNLSVPPFSIPKELKNMRISGDMFMDASRLGSAISESIAAKANAQRLFESVDNSDYATDYLLKGRITNVAPIKSMRAIQANFTVEIKLTKVDDGQELLQKTFTKMGTIQNPFYESYATWSVGAQQQNSTSVNKGMDTLRDNIASSILKGLSRLKLPRYRAGAEMVLATPKGSDDDLFTKPQLRDFLKANPSPKIVLRVPTPYYGGGRLTSDQIRNEEGKTNVYNTIEREFLKAGYTVRDRGLLGELLRENPSLDYQAIANKIKTDLILEIVQLKEHDMSNNRFIEKGSSKQGQLEDSKFPMSGLVLDVRIILIESGEIGGIYTLYVPPKKPFFRRFDFSDGAVNFPERAQQWWKSYKALNGNQGGYIHYIPCTDDGRLLKGNSHTIGDKGNMSIAKKLIQLLKSK